MSIFFIVNYIHRHEYIYLDILAYKKFKLFNLSRHLFKMYYNIVFR